jgi:hypothetical protein
LGNQLGGNIVQINTCCIQGKPPHSCKCIKNATCVLPQPGKRIAHVLHCVDKLPQVFTISFIFFIIIFLLLWPTASKNRPACGNPCHVPSLRERESASRSGCFTRNVDFQGQSGDVYDGGNVQWCFWHDGFEL